MIDGSHCSMVKDLYHAEGTLREGQNSLGSNLWYWLSLKVARGLIDCYLHSINVLHNNVESTNCAEEQEEGSFLVDGEVSIF